MQVLTDEIIEARLHQWRMFFASEFPAAMVQGVETAARRAELESALSQILEVTHHA